MLPLCLTTTLWQMPAAATTALLLLRQTKAHSWYIHLAGVTVLLAAPMTSCLWKNKLGSGLVTTAMADGRLLARMNAGRWGELRWDELRWDELAVTDEEVWSSSLTTATVCCWSRACHSTDAAASVTLASITGSHYPRSTSHNVTQITSLVSHCWQLSLEGAIYCTLALACLNQSLIAIRSPELICDHNQLNTYINHDRLHCKAGSS